MQEQNTSQLNAPTPPAQGLVVDPANLITILWRERRLIAGCTLGCLVFAVLYLLTTSRLYQASAKLLVLHQGGRPLNVTNADAGRFGEGVEDYIPTHIMVIRSPAVLGPAVEAVGLKNLASLDVGGSLEKAVRAVGKNLSVTRPDRQAMILQVDYRATSREE